MVRVNHWKNPSFDWISLPLAGHILHTVNPLIKFFRKSHNFISLHYRVEIASSNREQWAGNADFGGLEETVFNTSKLLQDYVSSGGQSRNLYVASYLPQEHPSFKMLKNAVTGFNFYTKFDFFPENIESEPTMTRNMMALIEFAVLENADIFIGNCKSSFSRTIARRRSANSRQTRWTYPCTQEVEI